MGKIKDFSQMEEEMIIERYLGGDTLKNLSERFSCCSNTIKGVLKRNQIMLRGKHRKFSLNENFFESIDSEEKAYWLGFIAADGNVSEKQSRITVELQLADLSHLEKLRASVASTTNIKEYTRAHSSCAIELNSKN